MKQSKQPKVLMLGWEFPPVINGGLGVACHDLSAALTKFAKVSMIIPKAAPGFIVDNLDLIGLNNVDISSLANVPVTYNYSAVEDISYVESNLNPYYSEAISSDYSSLNASLSASGTFRNPFDVLDLYGGDVKEKVYQFARYAAGIALTKDFDVIHAHDWMTMVAGMEIKAQTGKPLVIHVHSLEIDRSGEDSRGWVYQLEKQGMEAADLLLPVSNYTSNIIQKYYGISADKIFTVHNGISHSPSFKSEKPFAEKTVLFIGRLTRQKGPEYFLDIASMVHEINPNVRFIMAGTGEYFKGLLEQSSYKQLGNRFHLTGFLNNQKVKYLLSIADVYCMPSVSEPFGLSAVEAVQFGVPTVISKQSGVAEVLSGSLSFDHWDTFKAADYILRLLDDNVLSEQVAQDGYKNLENINWDLSAEKVIEAYKKLNICTI